jgi:hypothetical protein
MLKENGSHQHLAAAFASVSVSTQNASKSMSIVLPVVRPHPTAFVDF